MTDASGAAAGLDRQQSIRGLHLQDIQALELFANRAQTGDSPATRFSSGLSWTMSEDEVLAYRMTVEAQLLTADNLPLSTSRQVQIDEQFLIGTVRAAMMVTFSVDAMPSEDFIAAFGAQEVPMILTPFLREHIAGLALRLGVSGVNLPLMRRGLEDDDDAEFDMPSKPESH